MKTNKSKIYLEVHVFLSDRTVNNRCTFKLSLLYDRYLNDRGPIFQNLCV
jgi:hypothetical protein